MNQAPLLHKDKINSVLGSSQNITLDMEYTDDLLHSIKFDGYGSEIDIA
jgi:hypothetical protein